MASRLAPYVALLAVLVMTLSPRTARAQAGGHGGAIHILEVDSDDADDQAEALSGALRSRLRSSPGWNLVDTTQSLSMLTAALRCPRRPDTACLGRIAERLKAERFVWGLMNKAPKHQVVVELHLWSRGKSDQVAKETYSDNLKDQNDDALRKIATDLLEQLLGAAPAPPATVNVDAAGEEGAVLVDGEERGQLDHGHATLQVAPGSHVIELRGPNFNSKQTVDVKSPSTEVTFQAAPVAPPPPVAPEPSKPLPTRKIVGWTAVGASAAFLAVAGYGLAEWISAHNTASPYITGVVPKGTNPQTACNDMLGVGTAAYNNLCPRYNQVQSDSITGSALAIAFGSAAGVALATGIYLLATGKPQEESSPPPAAGAASIKVVPRFSPWGNGIELQATF